MQRKINIHDIIVILALASTLLYVVTRNLPPGIGSFRFIWGPLVFVTIIFSRPEILVKGPVKNIIIYGIISLGVLQYTVWEFLSDWNKDLFLYEFWALLIMSTIWSFYWTKRDYSGLALISKWAFIFILITLITTNIALFIDANVVRIAANQRFTPYQELVYNITGAASYGYAQAFILLIPVFVYHIKNKKRLVLPYSWVFVIFLILLVTLIRIQTFANFLVGIILTFLSFIPSKNRKKAYILFILISILIYYLPNALYSNFFLNISSYFDQGSEMHHKLIDFSRYILDPNEMMPYTGAGGRAARYPLLLEALLAKPYTGDASYDSPYYIVEGGHLWWMNKLTVWGVPGFLFFLFVLYKVFNHISRALHDREIQYYYFLSILALILLGLMKNIGGREPWVLLIVVIPGLYFLTQLKQYPVVSKDSH